MTYKTVKYTNIDPISPKPQTNSSLFKKRRGRTTDKGPVIEIPEDISEYDAIMVFFDWRHMRQNIDYEIKGNKIVPLGRIAYDTPILVELIKEYE